MIECTYSCDLCHDRHEPDDESLFGLAWSGGRMQVSRSITEYQHHICLDCFTSLCEASYLLPIESPRKKESEDGA